METRENLSLCELISYIDGIEIPDIFESELDAYILDLTNGAKIAEIIAQMMEGTDGDAINDFIDALEDHILEVMSDALVVVDSNMVTEKKMRLFRLIIHFRYK